VVCLKNTYAHTHILQVLGFLLQFAAYELRHQLRLRCPSFFSIFKMKKQREHIKQSESQFDVKVIVPFSFQLYF
jgi:hypothetical protein